ncbi:hypothetical protein evm_004941 [Chilo suppressalis]|nr:hypothetical protein evm_004941 [Chilo suppressalis]
MKCAVYHTHKWGGQPSLHNAMVSEVVPHQDNDQFQDLQSRLLQALLKVKHYTIGSYSHGHVVPLSDLKDAIDPNFETIKIGSRILLKLKPPDGEDISLTKKTSEKYHLWHRAVVKSLDLDKKTCLAKLEHGVKTGEKRKSGSEEIFVKLEEIFPLNADSDDSSDSDDCISDTEYPESKSLRSNVENKGRALLIEKSLMGNIPAMGEWERHTRGIGSKLMLAMGYVPGAGLGATGEGRVAPVEAHAGPARSLDACLLETEQKAGMDPLKVEQKLKRMQKKEEERNKRAYEREKERERRNVFNFLNRTLGDTPEEQEASASSVSLKKSSTKDLNIEQFKITEDLKRLERELIKLNSSLSKYSAGSEGHRSITMHIIEKNKELSALKNKEKQISREQSNRKDKQKMTIF